VTSVVGIAIFDFIDLPTLPLTTYSNIPPCCLPTALSVQSAALELIGVLIILLTKIIFIPNSSYSFTGRRFSISVSISNFRSVKYHW